jgi:nitrite reductase/ring-hydroxylating ferredoxin subunit
VLMRSATPASIRQIRAELALLTLVPRHQARAMSAAYYTSPEYLELEREELFRKQWICIGHLGEVPRPGDYFTTELIDEQLLVTRDLGGAVRVLSNVCRHRGNIVARAAGHAARFVCGYHAWTYGLDGHLLAAPLIEEGAHFDKRNCRLPQFATETWQGFIFVNLDGTAAPLATALAATEPYIRNYHPAERHLLFGAEETWNTNWKCLVENFMEGYHLSPTHANTLHAITPTALCEKLPDGPGSIEFSSSLSRTGPVSRRSHRPGTAFGRFLLCLPELRRGLLPPLHAVHVFASSHGRHRGYPVGHYRRPGRSRLACSQGLHRAVQGILRRGSRDARGAPKRA